jgi:hypothetical protein
MFLFVNMVQKKQNTVKQITVPLEQTKIGTRISVIQHLYLHHFVNSFANDDSIMWRFFRHLLDKKAIWGQSGQLIFTLNVIKAAEGLHVWHTWQRHQLRIQVRSQQVHHDLKNLTVSLFFFTFCENAQLNLLEEIPPIPSHCNCSRHST